jgi:hypothetical protein
LSVGRTCCRSRDRIGNSFSRGSFFWAAALRSSLAVLIVAAILLDFGMTANLTLGQRAIFVLSAEYRSRFNGNLFICQPSLLLVLWVQLLAAGPFHAHRCLASFVMRARVSETGRTMWPSAGSRSICSDDFFQHHEINHFLFVGITIA